MKPNIIFKAYIFAVLAVQSVSASQVTLEDNSLRVAFDSQSGALTRLENKATYWVIERRPELGVAFRLFAPLPERRWNPVFIGNHGPDDAALFGLSPEGKPRIATVKKISDGEVRIQWKNPVAENGGVLPMTLTADVTLTNGVLTFNAVLQNDSPLTIETLDYPYFGDFSAPSRDSSLELRVMLNNQPARLKMDQVYPHFGNEKGYWGVFWPLKTREAQQSPFCLISSPNEGLYAAVPATPYRLQWTFEQHPGVISSVNNLVPPEDEIAGTPVHLEFRACHFLFLKPHSTMKLTPVSLRSYQGGWHSGIALHQP